MAAEERFDPFTGEPVEARSLSEPMSDSVALGLEPPRYCTRCGRRMVVQISPDRWWATCSRHGIVDSSGCDSSVR